MAKYVEPSKLVYEGEIFQIEFYVDSNGHAPAEDWLDRLDAKKQQKFIALFVRLGDHGKIWNETKFKHLTDTSQIFEFKVDESRVLSFFFFGKRLILTNGFTKKGAKTPNEKSLEQNHARKILKNGSNRMANKSKNGWVAKKLADPKFRKAFEIEYGKAHNRRTNY